MDDLNQDAESVLIEIEDALENDVPHDVLISWVNSHCLSNTELDSIVGRLEDKGFTAFASDLADEIVSPTLETEIENNQPWFKNDKRNRAAVDEPKQERERPWVQRYIHLCNSQSNVIYTPGRLDSPIWRTDI